MRAEARETHEQTALHVCMVKALTPLAAQSDDYADSSVMLAVLCIQTSKQVKSHDYQNVHVMLGTWGGAGTWRMLALCQCLHSAFCSSAGKLIDPLPAILWGLVPT